MYMLVNFSRVQRDLVPSKSRDQIEWRVKSLTTYLVHVLHEKSNSLLSLFNLLRPYSISLPFTKIILTGTALIISGLQESLPVFHGQGREHSEHFFMNTIPHDMEHSFTCVSSVVTMSFTIGN
jgi:hypothetical protein